MDVRNQRIAVIGLMVLGALSVAGTILLSYAGRPVPEATGALAGVCVGSLGTFSMMRNGGGSNGSAQQVKGV
jgi:hypothetical protein